MFKFTYNDHELFESYINCDKAYYGGEYDFTFENRYLIYHITLKNKTKYILVDKKTGKTEIITTVRAEEQFTKDNATKLIPYILDIIKETNNVNYIQDIVDNPYVAIDIIFRIVLLNYGYNIREEQISLSKTMYKGLTDKQVALCEAEVGTGKTLAYLVASLIARIVYKKKYNMDLPITITTSSVELQKTLVDKEIPCLSRMLEAYGIIQKELKTVLRKGKEHYMCPHRFSDYKNNISKFSDKYSRTLSALEEIEDYDTLVDLDKYNLSNAVKHKICVKGSCDGCDKKNACLYMRFREYATESMDIDFQITNHNMYLAAQMAKVLKYKNIIRESCFIVIDEAHKFKEAAETTYSEVLTQEDIPEYINAIKTLCRDKANIYQYKKELVSALKLNEELFSLIRRIHKPKYADDDRGTVIRFKGRFSECVLELIDCLSTIESLKSRPSQYIPITVDSIRNALESIKDTKANVVWVSIDENDVAYVKSVPRDVDKELKNMVWDRNISYVLTSGTLSDGNDFEYFKFENGLLDVEDRLLLETKVESPFDYKNNSRLYIPKGLPIPDNNNKKYLSAISDEVLKLIEATNGHTAILFTSYRMLETIYTMLENKLDKYDLFKMTRGVNNVIADFKKSSNGVLFASGSMWEGVDCVGDRLSSVIIVRLPFPIRSILLEEKKFECVSVGDFVGRYCTPNMLIKLRQGAGRLLRSEKDSGIVSILDSRVTSGSYNDRVTKAMSKYPIINSIEDVAQFMKGVKTEAYFE